MPEFRPCFAYKSEIAGSNIRNGQLIIVVDTGEIFADFNGRRIALLQGEGGGINGDIPEFANFVIVNSRTRVSPSLSGGGINSGGAEGFPPPELIFGIGSGVCFAVFNDMTSVSGSISGGGRTKAGWSVFPAPLWDVAEQPMQFQIFT